MFSQHMLRLVRIDQEVYLFIEQVGRPTQVSEDAQRRGDGRCQTCLSICDDHACLAL